MMIMQNIQFTNMLICVSDYGDDNHRGGEGVFGRGKVSRGKYVVIGGGSWAKLQNVKFFTLSISVEPNFSIQI